MTNNKFTKISIIMSYIIVIGLSTYFLITVDFEGPLKTILILIIIFGPFVGFCLAKLSFAIDRWRYSKAAFSIGVAISKYIAPIAVVIFLVLAIFTAFKGETFYIAYILPVALLIPFIGVLHDEEPT